MVTKHIEKYLTTRCQTQAMNIDYTDLQHTSSHALYLIEKCSLWRARITLGSQKQILFYALFPTVTVVWHVGQVRMLEAQNRKLADELDKLKTKWGKETAQIKAMFQAELDEARAALDEAEKEKARLEIKVASLEEQIEELRVK